MFVLPLTVRLAQIRSPKPPLCRLYLSRALFIVDDLDFIGVGLTSKMRALESRMLGRPGLDTPVTWIFRGSVWLRSVVESRSERRPTQLLRISP